MSGIFNAIKAKLKHSQLYGSVTKTIWRDADGTIQEADPGTEDRDTAQCGDKLLHLDMQGGTGFSVLNVDTSGKTRGLRIEYNDSDSPFDTVESESRLVSSYLEEDALPYLAFDLP